MAQAASPARRTVVAEALGWGIALWLFGYALSFPLFFVLPVSLIGWAAMPIAAAVTVWVLLTRIKAEGVQAYLTLSVAWTAIAIVLDFFFIVQLLQPPDGYYKLDVYLYYILTFALPIAVGYGKANRHAGGHAS